MDMQETGHSEKKKSIYQMRSLKAEAATIRSARKEDAIELLQIYSHYVTDTAVTFEYDVPSIEDFEGRIENTLKKYPYLVVVVDEKIVGYAYAGPFKTRAAYDWACELSIYLDQKEVGKGYGRLLYEKLAQCLKEQGIINLYACIAYPEEEDEYLTRRSENFHKQLGFTTVGRFHKCGKKFSRWYDMIWMEKMIGQHL